MESLYDFAQIYPLVLERPAEVLNGEIQSIQTLLAQHHIPPNGKILELACGAGAHGIPLAEVGFQVLGVDRAAAMLAEAQRRAETQNLPFQARLADVVDFDLGMADFDAAIFMFETFPLITEYDDILSHFAAVRRHLKPGGLYAIDIDAPRHGISTQTSEWGRRTIPLADGYVETWYEERPGNWVTGTNHLILRCRICVDGQVHETSDDWQIRVYTPWELELLVQVLPGWRLDGFYAWKDLRQDISDQDHYLLVLHRN